uniref:BRCA1-A complex subunit Abraxas 1 n=1 Tax=Monopterus albus TaxID=43700 RepID=UPI0009B4BDE7
CHKPARSLRSSSQLLLEVSRARFKLWGGGTFAGEAPKLQFMNVPVLVNNLGLLEQLAYWKVSAPCSAAGYNHTVKKHSSRFFSPNGLLREVNEVNKMNESLQSELQKVCRDVEQSEHLVETLQAEVSALRRRVREKRQSRAGGESDDGAAEPKSNLLLHEAIRALFASSPLFHSQTLTLEAFAVPAVCCGSEQDDTAALLSDTHSLLTPSRTNCRKRLNETSPGRGRKRRKS